MVIEIEALGLSNPRQSPAHRSGRRTCSLRSSGGSSSRRKSLQHRNAAKEIKMENVAIELPQAEK
jgi:hypothetical protein